jgi:hypothetical protein
MLIWGGYESGGLSTTGSLYDPEADVWSPIAQAGAPTGGDGVWTGSEMLVWGGDNGGGSFDPAADAWTPISVENAPTPRTSHSSFWTDGGMIVWGGFRLSSALANGGIYVPADACEP